MRFFLLGFLTTGLWTSTVLNVSSAQTFSETFKVGAVLPLSGGSARVGQVAAAALSASAEILLNSGIDFELTVLDSESRPAYGVAQAKALVAAGVHALICCETAQASAQLVPVLAVVGLPVLSLATIPTESAGPYAFSLAADDTQVLGRLALAPPQPPLALMAPLNALGNRADAALKDVSVGVVRYSARTPLTPEALLAATLEPGSVVVWDGAAGTVRAAEALSTRGFTGVRVVRAEVWEELDALARAQLTGAVSVISPAVLGYRLPDIHPSKERVSSFRRALSSVVSDSDLEGVTVAAETWDAAQLLGAAAEQVLTYTDVRSTLGDVGAVRGALLDALAGLGAVVGVGGSYDFSGDDAPGLVSDSLVLGTWQSGRFLPYP